MHNAREQVHGHFARRPVRAMTIKPTSAQGLPRSALSGAAAVVARNYRPRSGA
jgi:hypothetical protein